MNQSKVLKLLIKIKNLNKAVYKFKCHQRTAKVC